MFVFYTFTLITSNAFGIFASSNSPMNTDCLSSLKSVSKCSIPLSYLVYWVKLSVMPLALFSSLSPILLNVLELSKLWYLGSSVNSIFCV